MAKLTKKQKAAKRGRAGAKVLACLKRNHRKNGKHYSLKARAACGSKTAKARIKGKRDRKSTRLNSSHSQQSRMPSSA